MGRRSLKNLWLANCIVEFSRHSFLYVKGTKSWWDNLEVASCGNFSLSFFLFS